MPSVIVRPDPQASARPSVPEPEQAGGLARWSNLTTRRFLVDHGLDVVMVATLLAWLIPLTHRFGGRDPGVVTLGLIVLIPALLLSDVRSLPRRHLLSLVPGLASLVSVVVSPRRGDGLDEAAMWLAAGLVYLVVAAWLRQSGRAAYLGIVILIAGLDQFFTGWWPWWGEGDASSLMRGSFFWHNQFAAFMIGTGLVAAAVVLLGSGRVRLFAALTFMLCVAGTYYSTSRASLAILAVGCVVAVVAAWRRPRRIGEFVLLGAGAGVLTWVLSSPLLMPDGDITSGFVVRTNNVAQNGMTRLEYWKAAVTLVREHPWVGTGSDSFGTAGMAVVGDAATPSTLVHNGFLQAFVNGGILLGGAVVVCAAVVVVVAAIVVWRSMRGRIGPDGAWRLGAALGVGALVLHTAVDFDWTYPSLIVLAAILSALVLHSDAASTAVESIPPETSNDGLIGSGRTGLVVVTMSALALVAGLMASGGQDFAAPTGSVPGWRTLATFGVAADNGQVRVPQRIRPVSACIDELRAWTAAQTSVNQAPPADLMSCTAPASASDPWVVTLRASALARSGDLVTADAMATPAVAQMSPSNARFALVPVELALLAGQPASAAQRIPTAASAVAVSGTDADRTLLEGFRLQIARQLPMSTQGASLGSADATRTSQEGAR